MTNRITPNRGFLSLCWAFVPQTFSMVSQEYSANGETSSHRLCLFESCLLKNTSSGSAMCCCWMWCRKDLLQRREGQPPLFLCSLGPPLCASLTWEGLYGKVSPKTPSELGYYFFSIRKTPGQKWCPVWAVLGLIVLYVPGWWMQEYVKFTSQLFWAIAAFQDFHYVVQVFCIITHFSLTGL